MSTLLTFSIDSKQVGGTLSGESIFSNYAIVVDATPSESYSNTAQVTENKVEFGSNIADHVRPMPDRLAFDGVITNTPIVEKLDWHPTKQIKSDELVTDSSGNVVQTNKANIDLVPTGQFSGSQTATPNRKAVALKFDNEFDRVRIIDDAFQAAQQTGALVTVDTSLRHYDNMVIESYDVRRSVDTGTKSLHFSLSLKSVRLVSTQEVDGPAPKHAQVSKPSKPTKPATPAEAEKMQEQTALLKVTGATPRSQNAPLAGH